MKENWMLVCPSEGKSISSRITMVESCLHDTFMLRRAAMHERI